MSVSGYQKIFYLAKQAQKQYEQTLVEAREGTPLNSNHQADKDFCQLFPVILTDNGGEFARVDDIEMDVRGESPKLLGISKIPAEDVCQSSTLLQHKF